MTVAPFMMMGTKTESDGQITSKVSRTVPGGHGFGRKKGQPLSLKEQKKIFGGRGLKLWQFPQGETVWALNWDNAERKGERFGYVVPFPTLIWEACQS